MSSRSRGTPLAELSTFSGNGSGAPVMKNDKTLEISLGDLLTEITEEALRFARNEEEANIAVANIVTDLLRNSEPISKCWH
jgi:hypothetical protein